MIEFAIISFALGLLVTLLLLGVWISNAQGRGWTVPDHYKPGKPRVATLGGLVVAAGWLLVLLTLYNLLALFGVHGEMHPYTENVVVLGLSPGELLLIFTALACGAMGLVDDLRPIPQQVKFLLPLFLALPLAYYLSGQPEYWPEYAEDWPVLLVTVAALLWVGLGTNLTNMHAGFNGLSAGNALIMLLAMVSVAKGQSWNCIETSGLPPDAGASILCEEHTWLLTAVLAGATAALLWFNIYPARVMEGNVGSHLWGGALAAAILMEGLWLEGLLLFIPQLIDLGLWSYARIRNYPFQKYSPFVDGKIAPVDFFKLKFQFSRLFPHEKSATAALLGLQFLSSTIFYAVVVLFRHG